MENTYSKLELLQQLPEEQKRSFFDSLTDDQKVDLLHDIKVIGRPQQQVPEPHWSVVLALCGRGWGKTFFGSHVVNYWANAHPGCRIALIGETVADVRDTMIRGESGILTQSHPLRKPEYVPSNRIVKWKNGSTAHTFSGEDPGQLRGPQFHFALVDELAKMKYQEEVWDMLQFCMRLGDQPQIVVTTTPRPTRLIKQLATDQKTKLITGSTFENRALPRKFVDNLTDMYEGTRLGRQELYAAILEDNPNALWTLDNIDQNRIDPKDFDFEALDKIVVAVDPAVTNKETSDDTGIVVVGMDKRGHGYVLSDKTMKGTPNEWAMAAVQAADNFKANYIVAEVNQGGDLVRNNIHTVRRGIKVEDVRASRGKTIRAEPVAALYEQNKIHHVGILRDLEDEMCAWNPSIDVKKQKSPNRMDALVWGLTKLLVKNEPRIHIWTV